MYASEHVDAVMNKEGKVITMCYRKGRYITQSAADADARRRAAETGKDMRTYLCPICGMYHMTSKPLLRCA